MKKSFVAVLLTAALALPTFAITEDQQGAISTHCDSIKNTLKIIQREDSRTRISLGATYEALASRFITPLNLRLVATNQPSPALIDAQSAFTDARANFSAKFIAYSRSLEDLIATNCTADPDLFYQRLASTRALRSEVNDIANQLKDSAAALPAHIVTIKEVL